MALTARAVYTEEPGGRLEYYPVANGVRIFDGALVAVIADSGSSAKGQAVNWSSLTGVTTRAFRGIARVTAETGVSANAGESVVGDSAGNQMVSVDVSGVVLRNITLTGADVVVGKPVYASDENTFTLDETAGLIPIGHVIRRRSATVGDIKLMSAAEWKAWAVR